MRFTRIVYAAAAVWGFVTLTPLYFVIGRFGESAPPAITHPEFYYGFIGLALLWQAVFFLIARNPGRYRALMPVAILEKLVFSVPAVILYLKGEMAASTLRLSLMDPVFAVLFAAAYVATRRRPES